MTTTDTDVNTLTTTQVYKVYIKAPAEKIWQAITDPEWTNRYGFGGFVHYDLRPGGALNVVPSPEFAAAHEEYSGSPCPDPLIDGEVQEADAPHKLVTTWRMLMDPDIAAEGFSRLTYEIKVLDGFCSLTVVHELEGMPKLAALVAGRHEDEGGGGGHAWILSDLKSLLETGAVMAK
jgi:uncharacterized protein YndB with AHSA1/START domain